MACADDDCRCECDAEFFLRGGALGPGVVAFRRDRVEALIDAIIADDLVAARATCRSILNEDPTNFADLLCRLRSAER